MNYQSTLRVPFINYPAAYQAIKPEIDEAITKCLERGDLIYREDLEKFENDFAAFVGCKYGIGTGSCTGAMLIALKALGIRPGDKVLVPAHTYIATIDVIMAAGADPVLQDVDYDTMNISQSNLVYPGPIRAIMPVHLNGRIAEIDYREPQSVIEDAAQAAGAMVLAKKAGSLGIMGCFSFYPAKVLGGYFEGGMVTTNDKDLARRLYLLRDHGEWPQYRAEIRFTKGHIYLWGHNTILDNIAAAVLNVKLRHLGEYIKRRREIANMYAGLIPDFGILKHPPFGLGDVWQNYVIRIPKYRAAVRAFLERAGIETMVHWLIPNHKQFNLGETFVSLPNTERLSNEVLSLPIYPEMTDEQVEYVADCVKTTISGLS